MGAINYEILRQAIRDYGKAHSYKDLERKSGISSGNLSRIADGYVKRPTLETWLALHRVLPQDIPPPPLAPRRPEPPLVEAYQLPGNLRRIPVFNSGAGEPSYFSDGGYPVGEAESYLYLPDLNRHVFAVRVCGDSMEPEIRVGDVVIVDPEQRLENGQLCFATWSDEEYGQRLVKVYREENGRKLLLSRNPMHGPITLDPERDQGVRLYRVVGHYKKY